MTVSQLISELQKQDPNAKVLICVDSVFATTGINVWECEDGDIMVSDDGEDE